MKESSEHREEKEPTIEALKNLEREKIAVFVGNILRSETFDKENPDLNSAMTPMEHHFIGSTGAGNVFEPNTPLAFHAGSTLESINRSREKNGVALTVGFFGKEGSVEYTGKLLPLTREMLDSEEPALTVEIISVDLNDSGGDFTDEDIERDMMTTQERDKERLIDEYKALPERI